MADRVILCGPVDCKQLPVTDRRPLRLVLWGAGRNIRFQYEQMRRWMCGDAPPVFRDLIDIAVYVYVADQAIRRGNGTDQDLGKSWRRRLFSRTAKLTGR
jgi:hypothetical protein